MDKIKEIVKQRIMKQLKPEELVIADVSHKHAGHNEAAKKGGTHFEITVVSEEFTGLTRIKRHKIIYKMLDDMMNKPIHALQLELKTPSEYNS